MFSSFACVSSICSCFLNSQGHRTFPFQMWIKGLMSSRRYSLCLTTFTRFIYSVFIQHRVARWNESCSPFTLHIYTNISKSEQNKNKNIYLYTYTVYHIQYIATWHNECSRVPATSITGYIWTKINNNVLPQKHTYDFFRGHRDTKTNKKTAKDYQSIQKYNKRKTGRWKLKDLPLKIQ